MNESGITTPAAQPTTPEHGEEFTWAHSRKLAKNHPMCNGKGYQLVTYFKTKRAAWGVTEKEPVQNRLLCRCVKKKLEKLGIALVWVDGKPYLPKGVAW